MKKLKRVLVFICFFFISFIAVSSKETSSYYSEKNAPEFYGMTKAIIQKDYDFDITKAHLRIFAKDFEDGDITDQIKVLSNNIDTSKVGSYEITYSVTDSHNNTTTITVPVEVVDDDTGNYYERTIYSLPTDVSYMGITGPRGSAMDRQITGLLLKTGATINMKLVSGNAVSAQIFSTPGGSKKTVTLTNDYQSISWTDISTVFIKTPFNGMDSPSVIGIQVDEEEDVIEMPYYHYGDDEAKFRSYWGSIEGAVGAVEGKSIIFYILPGENAETGFNAFGTIDAGLEFYDKLFDEYDSLLGYEYDADEIWNQNVKMKYFATGGGANNSTLAYFQNDMVVKSQNTSVSSALFTTGWAIIHEIGHGYEGAGLKEDSGMGLLEVSNNILGNYIQKYSDTLSSYYTNVTKWMDYNETNESVVNGYKANGTTFRSLGAKDKLYVLTNLLNYSDYKEAYSALARNIREWSYKGTKENSYSLAEKYTITFYQLYHVNVSSYFDAWGETISPEVKTIVQDGDAIVVLNEVVNDTEKSTEIKETLGKTSIYSVVKQKDLEEFNLTGNATITLDIDDISTLKGKTITFSDGVNTYKKTVESNQVSISLPAGNYQVTSPVPTNNIYNYSTYISITVKNNETNSYTIDYTVNKTNLRYDITLKSQGQGNPFSVLTFDSENITITSSGVITHLYWNSETNYAYVKILDENDTEVYSKEYKGSIKTDATVDKVPYKVGYKIIVSHDEGGSINRFNIYHSITGETITNLTRIKGVNTYIIGEYGLYQTTDDTYDKYKETIDAYAESLVNSFSEEELNTKTLKSSDKVRLLSSINELKDEDKEAYLEKYKYIYNGSSPELSLNTLILNVDDNFDIYSLLKGTDKEDGEFTLTKDNFTYSTNLPLSENNTILSSGEYSLSYSIIDKDSNKTTGTVSIIVKEKIKDDNNDKDDTNIPDDSIPDTSVPDDNIPDTSVPDTNKPVVSENETTNGTNEETSSETNKVSSSETNKVSSSETKNENTSTKKTNKKESSSNETSTSVSTNEEISDTVNDTNEIVNEEITDAKEESTKDNNKIISSSTDNRKEENIVTEEKHKLNIIDKWLDDEITPFETGACICLAFAMALILAYLNRIF